MMNAKDRNDSVWEGAILPKFSALQENISTKVCVIGGGITGVTVAYELARRGHEVTLVEAYQLGSGQTGRTTAHLTFQLEEQLQVLIKQLGQEKLKLFLDAHYTGVNRLEQIVAQEKIDCDFKRLDGYLFLGRQDSKELLHKEVEAAAALGLELNYVEETPLLTHKVPAVKFPLQGQFHPLKFLAGVVSGLQRMGVRIYENTHVSEIKSGHKKSCLKTEQGHMIDAEHLIVCTHSPINTRFHIHTKQFAYRTYVMGFEWKAPVKEDVLLWDTEDPYHYIRFVGDDVVIGGQDHRTGQDPKQDPFYELEKWSRAHLPLLGEVKWHWSGQIFEPADQVGFIGRNPGIEKNVYMATGESGIGMTSAAIASLLIPDLIEGKDNPWAKLFDPARSPVRGMTEFMKENVNVAYQYKDWITPSEVSDWSAIPEDKGAVVREGIGRSCIYHETDDQFEKKSAVCTHLGGIVHWNDIEKTWDCPCHGSRFNVQGQVIEGPAISGLQDK